MPTGTPKIVVPSVGGLMTLKFEEEDVTLETRATFRVVGIELGANERLTTEAHG